MISAIPSMAFAEIVNLRNSFAADSPSADKVNIVIEVIGSNGQLLATFGDHQIGDIVEIEIAVPYSG